MDETYTVTSIGSDTFYSCSVTSVSIPNTVISINSFAFYGNDGMTSIIIEDGNPNYDSRENCNAVIETASNTLIAGCKSTTIPESVTSIGNYAFYCCIGLTSINIPNSVATIGKVSFYGCSGLTSVTIPNSVISIGSEAFKYCRNLVSVNIPSSVTTIDSQAFYECSSLTSLFIPKSVSSIGSYAFADCSSLSSIVVEEGNPVCDSRENCNAIIGTPNSTVPNILLYGCKNTTIPNSVTSIGESAFRSCSGLTSINIPNSVTSIGASAFSDCTGLTSITIPDSVYSIGSNAFNGCSNLTSIVTPESLTDIGVNAFYKTGWYYKQDNGVLYLDNLCLGYKGDKPTGDLSIKAGTRAISKGAFSYCGLTSVTIPESMAEIGADAFKYCSGLSTINYNAINCVMKSSIFYGAGTGETTINVGDKVTTIPNNAFNCCFGLASIVIPESVTSIGDLAFNNCSGLTSVVIPSSVTSIGEAAFHNTGFTSVTLPESITSIGNQAFKSCSNLTTVNFNATNCATMGTSYEHVFYNCTAVTTLNIGSNVTAIPNYAFRGLSGLTTVTIPNSITTIGNGAFADCSNLTTLNYNATNCTSIGDNVFSATPSVTTLNIGSNVIAIPDYAFSGFSGLTSISIPNSVVSIGENAFSSCTGLTSISISPSVSSIGFRAFAGCSNLASIVVENGNAVYDSRDNCNAIVETASNTIVSGCQSTTIPSTISSIGSGAFYSCSGLTSFSIPETITSIGSMAFYNCTNLTSINIPQTVTSIGNNAFHRTGWYFNQPSGMLYLDNCCLGSNSRNIKETSLNSGTRLICDAAFSGIRNLTTVTIPESVAFIGYDVFDLNNINSITSLNPVPPICNSSDIPDYCILNVPAGSKEAYSTADVWKDFSDIIEIATVEVSTEGNSATFEIPTVENAVTYTVNVYSDEAMTQLVATINYDAEGKIVPMSTSLELSINGFNNGTYYFDVIAKSETGETLSNYTGTFEISTSVIGSISNDNSTTEAARYDIHGNLLCNPTKGINIVKMSDGTIRKELVK